MKAKEILIKDEDWDTPAPVDDQKLNTSDDSYGCNTCPYPVEILNIDDKEFTVTFKCLNPAEKETLKTIPINEYLNSMKEHTYLYNECSLCNKKQNEFKENPIYSYCIKCGLVICSDCMTKHLETNEKNHPGLNKEFIIKNNEKWIKCLLHPTEKNLAFCLKCNTHICKECMKSQKHINHTKINLIEVSVTDKIKITLKDIANIYKSRVMQLNRIKEKREVQMINEVERIKKKIEKQKKDTFKKIQKELQKELEENEKLLNANLYKLKVKYENGVKLYQKKFEICKDIINSFYKLL